MEDLKNLLQKKIPLGKVRQRTLFDIAKFPHRETVISNWYAYYLDAAEEHGLEDLFLQGILTVLRKKFAKEFTLNKSFVKQEVQTKNKKRIDLVIYGTGNDHGKQIIIENKIFHWLHNDLSEYWEHKPTEDKNKIGIILSLKREPVPNKLHGKFYNILHSEVIEEVQLKLDMSNITEKQKAYVEDFILCINNLTKDQIMTEQVQFYFDNQEAINKASETKKAALKFVISQLRSAADELGLTLGGDNEGYRWFAVTADKRVYYTVITNCLFETPRQIGIVIELDSNGLKKIDKLDNLVAAKIVSADLKHKINIVPPYYCHYASQYFNVNDEEVKDLKTFVVQKIKEIYEPIMLEIILALKD